MNICIAGGGTAGWLSALFVAKLHPHHTVTVVASSQIGVIGTGEGVTGELMDVIEGYYGDFGIDPQDFIAKTGAMPKYGILHKNWTSNTDSAYFGPIDGTLTTNCLPDDMVAYLSNFHTGQAHLGSFYGQLYEHDISPINLRTNAYDISTFALHFDARMAADYLQKVALNSPNCTLIDKKIDSAHIGPEGMMTAVVLEDGQRVEADFFIDATGFGRQLIGKFEPKWISYRKHLPVNTALPFVQEHEPGKIVKSYSLAHAQSSGWYWELPAQHRSGSGYVFCDDFITVDQAQAEIETTLGKKVNPIKVIKFDSGRLDTSWIRNCYAVGLASAFAEPLEATSIHSTIRSLSTLCHEFLQPTIEDTVNPASIRLCNQRINRMYDDFKDFISAHYQGGRTDSEFWRYMTHDAGAPTDFVKDIKEMCASRMPTKLDFPNYPGAAGWPSWCYILLGTGQLRPGVTAKYLNSDSMTRAGHHLNKLGRFAADAKLAHYSFQQHLDVVNNNFIDFIPRHGQEFYLGN